MIFDRDATPDEMDEGSVVCLVAAPTLKGVK